VKIREER
jgi:hypothetical protein